MTRVLFLFLVFFCLDAGAENWYVINEYKAPDGNGEKVRIRTVSRGFEEKESYSRAIRGKLFQGQADCISTECVTGAEYDEALKDVFDNRAVREIYLSFRDTEGYETRLDFLDLKTDLHIPMAEAIAKRLEAGGHRDVKVIYPVPDDYLLKGYESADSVDEYFTIGFTREQVKEIQGDPTSKVGNIWFFDHDMVTFDRSGKVKEFSNFSGKLKCI